ncbi:hypothetical protein ED733_003560 [Metarhizium rileyi]|uniref:Solute carrier family 40 member n=1 Tax=Metarhizium rileyi (strain RCEF 4871) TaxID=1649241 RepID=A0A5C6G8L8_METRR|nr:hypothetical protein ED733_003560 [Metarhizium rileyi]
MDGYSSQVAIVVNFGMNAAFVIIEYFAIARVYDEVPQLQEAKMRQPELHATQSTEARNGIVSTDWQKWTGIVKKSGQDFYFFLDHRAFLPYIAGAVLYLTVLSFAGRENGHEDSSGEDEEVERGDFPVFVHDVRSSDQVDDGMHDHGRQTTHGDIEEDGYEGVQCEQDDDGRKNSGKWRAHTSLRLDSSS